MQADCLRSFAALLLAGAVLSIAPPVLPDAWSRTGTQYLAFPVPPYPAESGVPPLPFLASAMESYYDWSIQALREVYHDSCVPIFPNGSQWSCDFLNVNGTAYLLQHADRRIGEPECCVFLKPWHPPAPDFVGAHSGAHFLKNNTVQGKNAVWWQADVPVQEGGPFGYGWYVDEQGQYTAPSGFYFGGFWKYANGTDASANVIQYYDSFTVGRPPSSTWEVPASCDQAKQCDNFPHLASWYTNRHG